MLFEIDNVELYFRNKAILNGIYLKIESGSVTGLLGSNGSGKTSLLSIIFGHLHPKYKLIRVDGKPFLEPLFKTGMASYLPQHHLAPDRMKVKTAFDLMKIEFSGFTKRFEKLGKLADSKFKTLSGGERRIIETYLILKSDAKLVLLDEPFTHLAPVLIEEVKRLILEERDQKAILITDHLYQDVIDMSDHLYLLKNGSTTYIENNNRKSLEDYGYLSSQTS